MDRSVSREKRGLVFLLGMKMYPQFRVCALGGAPVLLSYSTLVSAQVSSALLYFIETFPCEGPVLIDIQAPAPTVISSTLLSRQLETVQKEEAAGLLL